MAWIRDENGTPAKHCFLVYSFMHRYRGVIADSDEPRYFEVRERMLKGIPSAVVYKVKL